MLPRRRGFQSVNVQEKTRTHLLFSAASDPSRPRRKKRPHNKFHQVQQHKRDEIGQAGGGGSVAEELDPLQWTGNQRIIHFGPMAQRDPFFYFYPKGWDLLYPAQFGFFPYRTNKFRGSSIIICVWAFGVFLFLGGSLMIYLGYFIVYQRPFWHWTSEERDQMISPVQIAGPLLAGFGIFLLLMGLICSITNSQFLKLRHHHHRDQPASVTVYTTHYKQLRAIYETSPYQPMPPPAHPVLENPNARTHLLDPNKELKLFPPVMHGYSTLSLHGQSGTFIASPYNTLRAISIQRSPSHHVVELHSLSVDPVHSYYYQGGVQSNQSHSNRRRANSSISGGSQEKWKQRKSSSVDEPWIPEGKTRSSTGSSGGGGWNSSALQRRGGAVEERILLGYR